MNPVSTRSKLPPTPALTVDVIIELYDGPDRPVGIVLIERKNPPLGWALPGGFVDIGETVEHAACREAKEETGLEVHLVSMLGVYSDPARDRRGHTVSIVYVAQATGTPKGADDAKVARVFTLDALPDLVFDHAKILLDYAAYRKTHSSN